ncbi:MAG: substrate-binding domain-containing protein [Lachnospiraceae bacterium]|nr:substrate-binding domain-containing protein [Lachnospiraceae bacterium]
MIGALLAGCTGEAAAPAAPAAAPADSGSGEAAGDTAEAPAASGDLNVYGIYKAGDQTWFIDEGAAAEAAVKELGGTFTYVDAKMSPEECLKAVDNAVANKASGIVICVPDQTMSQAVVDKCAEAGIPVVAGDDALEVDGTKIAPWVGIDAYVIGEANGEWIANYAIENNLVDDPATGLLIMTMDTVTSCVPRAEGEEAKWKELCPSFDTAKIFKADYDGTTEKGNTAATAVITAHPEITKWLITGANEEGTIGACRALESAGLDKDACVVGLGGYMAKDEWNNKGADGTCMKAAAYFSSDQVGRGTIDVLMQLINGEEPTMETAVPAKIVTPENYKDIMGKDAE